MMNMKLTYDLHIHSCLSPCGDDEMTPANIVGMASIIGLDVIALTDHNSCKNCKPMMECAKEYGVIGIPGMELTTMEEIHVVCLFPTLDQAMLFDEYVYERLMNFKNKEEIFGRQQIVDVEDREIGVEPLLLINPTAISIDELWDLVNEYQGIMIPAHIEKEANSLLFNLGMIPPDSQFRHVEIKNQEAVSELIKIHPYIEGCMILHNSDAHYLQDLQEPIHCIEVEEATIEGVFRALKSSVK